VLARLVLYCLNHTTTTPSFFRTFNWRRYGTIMEGVNLFKVHYIYVWNYHSEIPLYY
jgi:hypothetical protein